MYCANPVAAEAPEGVAWVIVKLPPLAVPDKTIPVPCVNVNVSAAVNGS